MKKEKQRKESAPNENDSPEASGRGYQYSRYLSRKSRRVCA